MVRATARLVIRDPQATRSNDRGRARSLGGGVFVRRGCRQLAPDAAGRTGAGNYIVVAYNELGIHCMNQDFSRS